MASGNRPAPADKTAQKQQIGRPFEPGQSGNPAGRPKGSRNKLSEAFLQALAEDFEANGKEVVEKVRAERFLARSGGVRFFRRWISSAGVLRNGRKLLIYRG